MTETLRSELLGTTGLMVAAVAAAVLTLARRDETGHSAIRARGILVALIALQALHAVEEYATGFYERFPAIFGLAPWPATFFVAFNAGCLVAWAVAALGLGVGSRLALFPAWFLALASVANGVAHPLMALATGGYFPGLWTSPLLAVGGLLLSRRLMAATAPSAGWGRLSWLFIEDVLFTLVVPGAVMVWIPRDVFGLWGDTWPSRWTPWQFAALPLLALGLAIYGRCVWEFAVRGRGIPAPLDHPRQLVATGLYQYVRNPMYVGCLCVMVGQAVFFRSLPFAGYVLGWFVWINLNILLYEEPSLRRRFGDSYVRYTQAVRRWIPSRPARVSVEPGAAALSAGSVER